MQEAFDLLLGPLEEKSCGTRGTGDHPRRHVWGLRRHGVVGTKAGGKHMMTPNILDFKANLPQIIVVEENLRPDHARC